MKQKINEYPSWQYLEVQIGKDYNTLEEVEEYDARHGKFRNIDEENDRIIRSIGLTCEQTVLEISKTMLAYAAKKSEKLGIKNIVFCHAGFLTYLHTAEPVDAIVTSTALHHLPDFWKGIALQRLNCMMKVGGHLYLSDVIFSADNIHENIEHWILKLEQIGGHSLREDVEAHIRKEFSTYDWIVAGLLERAGFCIVEKTIEAGVIGKYLCRKDGSQLQRACHM